MKKIPKGKVCNLYILLLVSALGIAAAVTWPWWWPYLLWRENNTSWATIGPGVEPQTYKITDARLANATRIPKIIHQTWKDDNIPLEWREAQQGCKDMHPEFEYKLWTDAASRQLIADSFPHLLKTWDSYPFNIQRADIIRYVVLQKFGGYYVDLDIVCLRPLDFLGRYPFVMPKTWPVGFSNDFLASEPGNPFVVELVKSIPKWSMNLLLKYPTVMFSTGPMFVTLKASLYQDRKSLWVLTDDMYNKYAKGEYPLFAHLHGSTWHGEDAKILLWVKHHPIVLAMLTLAGLISLGTYMWRQMQAKGYQRLKISALRTKSGDKVLEMNDVLVVKDS